MSALIDFVLHIDSHLITIVNTFGNSSYFILFAIIFVETGVVILPFLPGDSLLFAAAALAANPIYHLNIWVFILLFLIACMAGDSSNYWIGHNAERLLSRYKWFRRFINEDSLAKGQEFFEKHGAVSIILARFMPIIRTFVPFVAAGAGFPYRKFIRYNWIACIAWVALCTGAGYFFGNIPVVKEHFSAVIIGIIVVSLIPAVVGFIKGKTSPKEKID
ncbi:MULTISPECIES: VTT domain-containing protein [Loigolactobacillus]|uniref:Cytochrome O ubiquinol oxidase n=1 Tax=Loigolactobacillus backii TaxID=375175 RepID=A0A192GZS4_9LACO|nr:MULTISPECIES: VTT domain-containing protein [Loigolactobacillus]ANK58835.1 cytochrome O ubiquinol oxidase [Loigolactobacillus backii]ANK61502.1 cytochrome O ubiquinol oxidase [Loigolactobacillus backii]ANK63825.1 cytochrome O ubiquinol oxidase [Loigolactobacillus backii]ANK66273.1 cytochrome O ubiquinol oxidase [Loigolactobacillus backii]ANK69300.1 cytochrome O ubiquinol oxidase [Loigolactobacillus backii]